MIYGNAKYYTNAMEQQLKEEFPTLTQGRRKFVINTVMRVINSCKEEVFGVSINKDTPVLGEYMRQYYVDTMGQRVWVWIAVG